MKKITVLIVDDSALIRHMFSDMLSSEPDITVLGTASDPFEAREKIKQLNPDVLTLDIEMPKMDGLSFLEKIMTLRPMPVIMISSLTQKGTEETLRALELGAFDYLSKPVSNQNADTIGLLKEELLSKVRAAANANMKPRSMSARHVNTSTDELSFNPPGGKSKYIIAIGASTGGVEALRDVFVKLPKNTPPILVTQHMPGAFTKSFATRLNSISNITVSEAVNYGRLQAGHAYIAPGGDCHLRIARLGGHIICKVEEGSPVSGHRPSVDALFLSVAQIMGSHAVGVILTGMGKDGALGMKAMHEAGAYNIGQNQGTCVVYGMPQMAKKMGAIDLELPLSDIPSAMLKRCERT